MKLYSGSTNSFIDDSIHNRIAETLKNEFFQVFGYNPSNAECNSWRNSLRAMSQIIDHSALYDNGIIIEYQLPLSSKRLDCMITGCDSSGHQNSVIVELKQWDSSCHLMVKGNSSLG